MSETSELILKLRALGMSQSEIARRTGIPQPRISRWESGDVSTGADDALKLLRLFHTQARKAKRKQNTEDTNA